MWNDHEVSFGTDTNEDDGIETLDGENVHFERKGTPVSRDVMHSYDYRNEPEDHVSEIVDNNAVPTFDKQPKVKQTQVQETEAATKIQSAFRGHKQRRVYKQEVAKKPARTTDSGQQEQMAAVKIQSVFRGHNQREKYKQTKVQHPQQQDEKVAAVKIQAVFRGHKQRKHFNNLKQQQPPHKSSDEKDAAVKIQSLYRGHKQRQGYEKEKQQRKQEAAATKIQSVFRGHKQREYFKKESNISKQPMLEGDNTPRFDVPPSPPETLPKHNHTKSSPQKNGISVPSPPKNENQRRYFDREYEFTQQSDEEDHNRSTELQRETRAISAESTSLTDVVKRLHTEITKKSQRISELKNKNKQLAVELQQANKAVVAGPPKDPDVVALREKVTEMKKRIDDDNKVLNRKEDELDNMQHNYARLLKILQTKKLDNESKTKNNSWKSELVKRNKEILAKQEQIDKMEERLHAISNEKEKQTLQHAQVVSKLENELAVLKNEVDVLHQVLKERGVTPPETGKSNGLDAEGKAKKLAPLKSIPNAGPKPIADVIVKNGRLNGIKSPPRLEPLTMKSISMPSGVVAENPALTAPRVNTSPFVAVRLPPQDNPALTAPRVTKPNTYLKSTAPVLNKMKR